MQRTMQLIPPNIHQLDCDLSAVDRAIQLLNNWGYDQGNQSHCPLHRVIHILNSWAHQGGADYSNVVASYPYVTLSMKICVQRKTGEENVGAPPFFTLPMFPCGSSPVTRVSHSPASMRNQVMWRKIMTFNRFSPCFRMQTYSCFNSRCHRREKVKLDYKSLHSPASLPISP